MSLPGRTLCWVEGPPWDRTCNPVDELVGYPFDAELLRRRLHDLDNKEMGKVIAIAFGVLVNRGINLNTFLPDLAMTVVDDEELQRNLQRLGEL